jgi:lysophospholipase
MTKIEMSDANDFWERTLPSIEDQGGTEHYLPVADHISIRTARFPARGTVIATTLILAGRTEFIEKYLEVAEDLTIRGHDVWAFDWRGQGLSGRPLPNPHKGHIASFDDYVADLENLVTNHIAPTARAPLTILSHSTGGLIALHYLMRRPAHIRNAVLAAPMTKIEAGTLIERASLRLLLLFSLWKPIGSLYTPGFGNYTPGRIFERNPLSGDEIRFGVMERYIEARPELALGGPTLRWLAEAHAAMAAISRWRTPALFSTPTLFVCVDSDRVVGSASQKQLAEKIPNARFEIIHGAQHEILMEQDRYRDNFWALFDEFLNA